MIWSNVDTVSCFCLFVLRASQQTVVPHDATRSVVCVFVCVAIEGVVSGSSLISQYHVGPRLLSMIDNCCEYDFGCGYSPHY